MSELRDLAKFIHDLNWKAVPDHVKEETKAKVLDTVGVGIGACENAQIRSMTTCYREVDSGKDVSVWGQKEKFSLLTAVYLNGCEGHTLEMDDVHTGSKVHIGTVVVPAVWSLSEFYHKNGRELLLAVLCGYEVAARIGMALGVKSHRALGWHATATAGIIGAAAASAKLLGLSEDQIVSAMGMAGQISGGTWAFLPDGASCKVMNPAMAACNGVKCALNAKAGMTGPEHVLTSSDGAMLAMMSKEYDVTRVNAGLGTDWEIEKTDNKPYPCCRSTHCTIDAALDMKKKYGLKLDDIAGVKVYTYDIGNLQCGVSDTSRDPKIPPHAKFSTPFTVAAALKFGKVGLAEFEQKTIDDPEIRSFLPKVEVVSDDEFTSVYPAHWGCREVITLKNGKTMEETVRDASGSVDNPVDEEGLIRKISGIVGRVKDEETVKKIVDRLLHIEDADPVTI